MANWNDPQPNQTGFGRSPSLNGEAIGKAGLYDQGLRRHMLAIYNYMASGVLLSGIVALLFAQSGMAAHAMVSPLPRLIILSPLALVMIMSVGVYRMRISKLPGLISGFCTVV